MLFRSRRRSVSKTRPASGSCDAGSGCTCCTLREYGVPALPMSGSWMLLQAPSACRQQYGCPTYVLAGCGRSLYTCVRGDPKCQRRNELKHTRELTELDDCVLELGGDSSRR